MLIRICGACMVLIASCGIGFQLSRDLNNRLEDIKTLKRLVIMLRGEIKYANSPLCDAFRSIGKRMKDPYREFLLEIADKMEENEQKDFSDMLKKTFPKYSSATRLSDKDVERFLQFGEHLGYLDKEMQMNTIELYLEELEASYRDALEKRSKNSKLYQYLGAAGGILIVLFIW